MSATTPFTTPSFTASYQTGQIQTETPIPQDPNALWLHVTYEQEAYQTGGGGYTPAPLDYQDPNLPGSFYLVANGPANWKDSNLCQYTDIYANLPDSRNEFQSYQFTFPAILNANTGAFLRPNVTRVVASRVAYTYYHGTTPTASISITQQFTPVFTSLGFTYPINFIQGTKTIPNETVYQGYIASQTEICIEATQFKRWAGNFYEVWTRYAPAQ